MKIETRGKYPGVKLHLDPPECEILTGPDTSAIITLAMKMGLIIFKLNQEEPTLLEDRTPEQIAAILAKEVESATLKLARMKQGKDWKKINPEELQEALLKHVPK